MESGLLPYDPPDVLEGLFESMDSKAKH